MNQVLALQTALESDAAQGPELAPPPSCSSQSVVCTIITK